MILPNSVLAALSEAPGTRPIAGSLDVAHVPLLLYGTEDEDNHWVRICLLTELFSLTVLHSTSNFGAPAGNTFLLVASGLVLRPIQYLTAEACFLLTDFWFGFSGLMLAFVPQTPNTAQNRE